MSTVSSTTYGSTGASSATSEEIQAAITLALMGYGSTSANQATTTSASQTSGNSSPSSFGATYTVTAADVNSADPWAAIAQKLYGTSDAEAIAQLKAAIGQPVLAAGLQIAPPIQLAYEKTLAQSAMRHVDALTSTSTAGAFTALETATASANGAQVVYGPDGKGLAVWTQGQELLASTFDKSNGSWSAPTAVNAGLLGFPGLPSLSSSANGNMLLTWTQGTAVYARRFIDGQWDTSSTSIPQLTPAEFGTLGAATGTINDAGQAAVVVVRTVGEETKVAVSVFDGNAWELNTADLDGVDQYTSRFIRSVPRIAMDESGNLSVAWAQEIFGSHSLRVNQFNAAQGHWSAQPLSIPAVQGQNGFFGVDLKMDRDGNALLVWIDPNHTSAFAKRFDREDSHWEAEVLLTSSLGALSQTCLAMSANGHAIFAFADSNEHLRVRRYVDGEWLADCDLVNASGQGQIRGMAAAINNDGQAVVSFNQNTGSGDHTQITRLNDGAWTEVEQVESVATMAPKAPVVAIDAEGAVLVVASLRRAQVTSDLYGKSYSAIESRYIVSEGATWESVTEALYGSRDAAAVDALKARLGQTSLVPGQPLSNLPAALDFTKTQAVQKTINPAALNPVAPQIVMAAAAPAAAPAPAPAPAPVPHVVGYTVATSDLSATDPWASIAQKLYGDAAAGASLKQSLGQPALWVGAQISPPVNLAFDRTMNGQAVLSADRLSQAPGSWDTVSAMESSPGDVYTPQVAFGANGDGLAVWAQGADLMASVYTQATGSWAPAAAIDGNLPDGPFLPHLSASANGNMLVTWMQDSKLYARRYVNGAWDASSSSIPVVGTAAYYSTGSINDNGQATVVFAGNDGLHWNAVARYFDGQQWQSSPIRLDDLGSVNSNDIDAGQLSRVVMDPAGNATVMWLQPAVGETAASLFVSRFEAASGQWSNASSTLLENSGAAVNSFRVAADASGNCVATWVQGGQLYAKSFDIGTRQWGAASLLASGVYADISLSMSGNGNAIVAFNNANGTALYARRYVNGAWAGSAAELLSPAQTSTSLPHAAINDSGAAIVTFTSYDGVGAHVYTNRFEGGAWRGPEQAESSAKFLKNSAVAIDAAGNAQVVMSMVTGVDNFSLYGKRFNAGPSQYVVPAGSTWESVTEALYGTRQAQAVEALKAWVGTPLLTTGQVLNNPPPTLNYTWTQAAQRTIDPEALNRPATAAPSPAPAASPSPAPAPAPAADPVLVAQLQAQLDTQTTQQAAAQSQVDALTQQYSQKQLALSSASSAAAYAQQTLDVWNAPVTAPPRGRPQEQWNDIAASWAAYNGQPQYLMQLMVQYGFDAYDLAYVTGQSVVQIGQYLTGNGAFDGFANWSMSGYQAMVANATQLQQQAQQATLARNQALQAIQNAQIGLNALNDQVAQTEQQMQQAQGGGTSGSGGVFGGGGIPGSGTPDPAAAAALALMGYGRPAAAAPLVQAASQSATVASTPLATAPRERPAQQWADIKAVWEDRQDEPQKLMELMAQYGFDVADLAYATGQSLSQVGAYLLSHGAPDGFANWTAARGYTGEPLAPTPTSKATDAFNNQLLAFPPRQRPQQQWADIKAVWEDRQDEPTVLMDLMRQYGFDTADLAYATGQTLAQVGTYLLRNGAADGFAGWTAQFGYLGKTDLQSNGAPRSRSADQWAIIKAVWIDRNDEPYRLMQMMVEFGFDARDLAYATNQSLDSISLYLSRAGAPVGFGNANIIDQATVDRAYLDALDLAIKASVAVPSASGGLAPTTPAFDVRAFTAAYVQQNSSLAQDFLRLHGADFSATHAVVTAGHWTRELIHHDGSEYRTYWTPSSLSWSNEKQRITAYLGFSKAGTLERSILELELLDPLNQEIVRLHGKPVQLPESELGERMRARYGTELATRMLQLRLALPAVSEPVNRASNLAFAEGRFMVDRPSPFTGMFGNDPSDRLVPMFDPGAFFNWYVSQDTAESRLYKRLFDRDVADLNDLGGGDYVAQSNLWPVDLNSPPELINPDLVFYDPLFGFVTLQENLKVKPNKAMPIFAAAMAAMFAYIGAPMLAEAIGYGGSAIAVAGFSGAISAATSSLILTGNVKFKDVMRSAITSMLVAGFAQATGLNKAGLELNADGTVKLVNGVPVVTSYALRAMSVLGTSTFKGLLSELTGGQFRKAFVQGLADGLAAEVMQAMSAEIKNRTDLSPTEKGSALLLIKATGSAIRIAGNPSDPAYAFASDFLSQLATTVPEVNVPTAPVIALAFDDEGFLMPGIVNPALPKAQQQAQLFNQLLLQGMNPADAQSLTQYWAASDTALGWSGFSDVPKAGISVPTVDQAKTGLLSLTDERFEQLVRSMLEAKDEAGLRVLAALIEGGNKSNSAFLGVLLTEQFLLMQARLNRINTALKGFEPLAIPGYQNPDPNDPLWAGVPAYNSNGVNWQDLVNTNPANWPNWAQNILERLKITGDQLKNFSSGTWLPVLVTAAADLIIEKSNSKILGENLEKSNDYKPANGYAAHHMILSTGGGARMDALRNLLKNLNIDINDAANGVWLPGPKSAPDSTGAYHARLHNSEYYDAVEAAFRGVTTRDDALDVLQRIKSQLENETFPGVRPRP